MLLNKQQHRLQGKLGEARCTPVVHRCRKVSAQRQITARSAVRATPIGIVRSAARVSSRPCSTLPAFNNAVVAATASENSVLDTVIIGGGISGLVAAQALAAKHDDISFMVTEGRDRVGGNITSMEGNGYIWEEGPNSFQPNDAMLQIAVDAGVDKELVFGDPTAPRFVYWDQKLRKTPSGPDAVTFDLLSIWGKIRAGLGAIGIKPSMPEYEESVEQFIRRNLGAEVFERLIEPFCSGVYAGNPAKLGMQAAFGRIWGLEKEGGSLVGGAIKLFQDRKNNPPPPRDPRLPPKPQGQTVGSFRNGLKTLPEAIARNLPDNIRVGWQLQKVTRNAQGVFQLEYKTPQGSKQLKARTVVLTVPAYVAADLLQDQTPKAAEALRTFDYPPVAAVTLAYPLSAVKDERRDPSGAMPGFGQLHPRTQGVVTLGTIYSSSLFPGRAPTGEVLLLNYIGGTTNRGIVQQPEDDIVAQVDKDLRLMLLKQDAPPPKKVGVRVWPRAIPQFNVGHLQLLGQAQDGVKEAGLEGLILGGNYVAGVALGKCVEHGYDLAEQVSSAVKGAKKEERQPAGVA